MSGSQQWKKTLRKNVVKTTVYWLDKSLWFLKPEEKGKLLFKLHFWGFILGFLYIGLFGQRLAFQLAVLFALLILFMLWLFDGCILTRIEQYYTNTKETVVDIFLIPFGIKPTNDIRYILTVLGYSYLAAFIIILYIREALFGITCGNEG